MPATCRIQGCGSREGRAIQRGRGGSGRPMDVGYVAGTSYEPFAAPLGAYKSRPHIGM